MALGGMDCRGRTPKNKKKITQIAQKHYLQNLIKKLLYFNNIWLFQQYERRKPPGP
jgi:hypothetical protein